MPKNENALTITQQDVADIAIYRTPDQIKQQRDMINELYRKVMKKDVHYGVIPGTVKPTLLKPGAELLLSMFKIAVCPRVEDLSTDDCRRYRVFTDMTHEVSDQALGAGLGSCSSNETRYKWREALCQEEFDDFPQDRRRIKYKKTNWNKEKRQYNVIKIQQVRAEIDDVDNTVLKIATKRAMVAGTLAVTACSDMFIQDLEDMDEETRDQLQDEPPPPQRPRQTAPLEPGKEANRGHGQEGMKDKQVAPEKKATKPIQNWVIDVRAIHDDKKTSGGVPYLVMDVDDGIEVNAVTCWHQSLFDACHFAVGKQAGIRVFRHKGKTGDLYWVLDSIDSIDGKKWGAEVAEKSKPAAPDSQAPPANNQEDLWQ
jgi:hypothetical protein